MEEQSYGNFFIFIAPYTTHLPLPFVGTFKMHSLQYNIMSPFNASLNIRVSLVENWPALKA